MFSVCMKEGEICLLCSFCDPATYGNCAGVIFRSRFTHHRGGCDALRLQPYRQQQRAYCIIRCIENWTAAGWCAAREEDLREYGWWSRTFQGLLTHSPTERNCGKVWWNDMLLNRSWVWARGNLSVTNNKQRGCTYVSDNRSGNKERQDSAAWA